MAPDDLEYQAEFERQQFEVYEARRAAEEAHANAVFAAAVAVAAFVFTAFGRATHPPLAWFTVALAGLVWVFVLALNARSVSWDSPRWMRSRCCFTITHWRARAKSTFR